MMNEPRNDDLCSIYQYAVGDTGWTPIFVFNETLFAYAKDFLLGDQSLQEKIRKCVGGQKLSIFRSTEFQESGQSFFINRMTIGK